MKNCIVITLAAIIFSSCASIESMHLSVLEPPPGSLPLYIKNVAVSRTQVSKKSKVFDAIDKIVTLEGAKSDQEAAEETIAGLTDELKKIGGLKK